MPTGVYERKQRPMRMAECHLDRKHFGKGLCSPCYHKAYHIKHKHTFVDEFGKNIPEGFYNYIWFREDGTPYYIGKGNGKRAYTNHGHSFHRPTSIHRIFVQYWESEEKAFEMEKWYIAFYGRRDNCTGILRNLTNGGEKPPSAKGIKRSEKTRAKMSEAQKLNGYWRGIKGKDNPSTGRKRSEDTKKKLREAWERRKANVRS